MQYSHQLLDVSCRMMLIKLLPLLLLAFNPSHVTGQSAPAAKATPPKETEVIDMDEILRYLCGEYVCPRFEINLNLSTSDYDVREYPEVTYVLTEAPPPDENGTFNWNIMREMFKNLRGYFDGNNDLKQAINLTAPSLKHLKLDGNQQEPILDFTAFYLPLSIKPVPQPIDSRVKVIKKPAFKAYVRIFYGCPERDDLWRINIEALRAALVARLPNYKPTAYYYSASYGPQARLYCPYRRNEIWIVPDDYPVRSRGSNNVN